MLKWPWSFACESIFSFSDWDCFCPTTIIITRSLLIIGVIFANLIHSGYWLTIELLVQLRVQRIPWPEFVRGKSSIEFCHHLRWHFLSYTNQCHEAIYCKLSKISMCHRWVSSLFDTTISDPIIFQSAYKVALWVALRLSMSWAPPYAPYDFVRSISVLVWVSSSSAESPS